jgi:transketolase
VVCATDANHLRSLLRLSLEHPGAMYLRLGRGRDPEVYDRPPALTLGRAQTVRQGTDLTLIATGSTVHPSLDAAQRLSDHGVSVRVVDMWTVAPLDRDAVRDACAQTSAVLTVEEANLSGGLGSAVAECIADEGFSTRFRRHGVPDEHVPVGPPAALYAHYRLDGAGIADVARELLDQNRTIA